MLQVSGTEAVLHADPGHGGIRTSGQAVNATGLGKHPAGIVSLLSVIGY